MHHLSIAWTGIYYIAYPIFYVLFSILRALSIITAPLLHLGHYIVYACWYPIHVFAKFETLYIFFGVAVLVGVLTGTSLHYASAFLVSMFNLETRREELRGGTLSSYRAEKQERAEMDTLPKVMRKGIMPIDDESQNSEHLGWKMSNKVRGRHRSGLVPTTILEEEDSTEDGF